VSALGQGTLFAHFTDAKGITGITGVNEGDLVVGQPILVKKLSFGSGNNDFLTENPGDLFVTDLGIESSQGQLESIGVFGNNQDFVIQFSQETALVQKIRPKRSREHIYTIRGGTLLQGIFLVQRLR